MARNREKKHQSLVHQVEMKLKSKMAIGHSKHDDQRTEHALLKEKRKKDSKAMLSYQERITIHKIYTWSTFQDYQKHACYFIKWCKEHYGCRMLSECRQYVDEWLMERSILAPIRRSWKLVHWQKFLTVPQRILLKQQYGIGLVSPEVGKRQNVIRISLKQRIRNS
ncbi:hypothetical protein [Anaerocolumna xylanovorans]|uniref:Uncharacterized protein n=1 Tax=Anaerocolumna xylanovorans DSM 12503 TaxID=1121345 RepID=A0A1M7Y376_9FIRM|nr:hypothetical protein [Anaerocolumna xylanovorans]SHO46613.1 hypothetical protein SAMN02745217_01230 [Anaerocolumna xylanovorans DSM 12503]